MNPILSRLGKEKSAMLEVALLFLPAIPAYLWMWPAVEDTHSLFAVQSLVYLYFIAGAFFIGLRRWSLDRIGVNMKGLWFSLFCGLVMVVGRTMVLVATDVPLAIVPANAWGWLREAAFYFLLVGFGEELLFRGVLYRALEDWRGHRWAIWGSTLAFGVYHIGNGGLLGIFAGLVIGAILGGIRWRAGGILGLSIAHGLIDLGVVEIAPDFSNSQLTQIGIDQPVLLLVGYALLVLLVIYLWRARQADSRGLS